MLMLSKKFITDILTDITGEKFDNGKVLCFLSFVVYFGLAFGNIFISKPWQAMDFAGGIGTMAVGFGVHLNLTKDKDKKIE